MRLSFRDREWAEFIETVGDGACETDVNGCITLEDVPHVASLCDAVDFVFHGDFSARNRRENVILAIALYFICYIFALNA